MWDNFKQPQIRTTGVPKEEKRGETNKQETHLKTIVQKFSKFGDNYKIIAPEI